VAPSFANGGNLFVLPTKQIPYPFNKTVYEKKRERGRKYNGKKVGA